MTYQNPYEMVELADDRSKTIHHDVKQLAGGGKGGTSELSWLLLAVVVLGAALIIVIGL